MNWHTTGSILLGLGIVALVVGVLLRFRVGRWLLGVLWLLLTLGSLLSGDLHALDNPDANTTPQKASRYCLLGGSLGILIGLALRMLASKSIY
ncbi:hypothetical protein [Hymenobacter sediminicola]|uniref:Uncharacterized protein n=1 Tax=Hymenobacter sediminicola TaxID=2761579 RepID=A0A7G7W4U9_9BACT|nr:hypothetical protein [Hymenobacter sediminicola]QNH61392.1 hypothetical protein H4317_14665 [Hymenobacter sediminicola]